MTEPIPPRPPEPADRAATAQAVVASLLAGEEEYLATWQRLPTDDQLAAWLDITARGLGLLAAVTGQQLAQAQEASGSASVAPWVRLAIEASRSTELTADVLIQAWLTEYESRGLRVAEEHDGAEDPLAIGARQAILGSRLLMGQVDGDTVRVRQLMKAAASPEEIREALVQVVEAVATELAEATASDQHRVLQILATDH